MEVIQHKTACCNYQVGNNVGTINFVFNVKENNDEGIKLVVIAACEKVCNTLFQTTG